MAWLGILTRPRPAPEPEAGDGDDELTHYTCCYDENRALCGADLSRSDWADEDDEGDCAVCAAMDEAMNGEDEDDAEEYCAGCPLTMKVEGAR